MEGILTPLPWAARRRSIWVPYLAPVPYQPYDGSFDSFPQRNGYPQADDALALGHSCGTIGVLTGFFQSWMFFELLAAFLGRNIDRADFVTNGHVNLNRQAVHRHFQEWQRRMTALSHGKKQLLYTKSQELIKNALSKAEVFEEAANCLNPNDDDFDRVALSVRLLINTLSTVVDDTFSMIGSSGSGPWGPRVVKFAAGCCGLFRKYFNSFHLFEVPKELYSGQLSQMSALEAKKHLHDQPNRFRPLLPGQLQGGRAASRLLRLFVDNNWCPYRALQLCQSYDFTVLNSLASLLRDASHENHDNCLKLGGCHAHDLATDSAFDYPFRHTIEGPHDCDFVHAPREEIAEIIKSGDVPIISISLHGELDLRVIRRTPWTTYTAISHIWSDGLGNPKSNALPKCQLLRLREIISETYSAKNSPFYDTSTNSSVISSRFRWEFFRRTRENNPYYKISDKRVYFWMDTLCIPVKIASQTAEESKELKFRAMKHISPVFAGAFNTLILDRGLQAVDLSSNPRISGDEFAAIIMSSNWMKRGWTLEEGSLSPNCVFRMMEKPYDMTVSLSSNIPQFHLHSSPLERASNKTRMLLPLLLNRAMLDMMKQLSNDPNQWRAKRLAKVVRIPQFVWTWNSLIERSTTKKQDGPVILANLLDFNVYALKSVPQTESLTHLIRNCEELPLSLLYNTGPRMSLEGHPEMGWIPKAISGDYLITGAALRRRRPNKATSHLVTFIIDRSGTDPKSFLVLRTPPEKVIPYDVEIFKVSVPAGNDASHQQEYIVEVHRQPIGMDTKTHSESRSVTVAREIYNKSSQGTCLVLDLAYGAESRGGYAGKGTRLCISSAHPEKLVLKYDSPLTIWTSEQWEWNRQTDARLEVPFFDTERVRRKQHLLLTHDAALWSPKKLFRRPFLTQHPLGAKLFSGLILLIFMLLILAGFNIAYIAVRRALGIKRPFNLGRVAMLVAVPFLATFISEPIRRRVAMYTYARWLRSFDEGDDGYGSAQRAGRMTKAWAKSLDFSRRVGRGVTSAFSPRDNTPDWDRGRGVTQLSIRLPSRQRYRDEELPGEVHLD